MVASDITEDSRHNERPPAQGGVFASGPVWLTAAAVAFAVMAVFVRLAGERGIPGSEATAVRFLFGILTVQILGMTGAVKVRVRRVPLLVARGVIGGTAILFYFLSLSAARGDDAIPLTNSVFLGNSYFIYVPVFGALLIRERLCAGTAAMVVVALVGLYLVAEPDFSDLRPGNVYGFLAGLLGALGLIAVRELRRTESSYTVFMSLCIFGFLAALVLMPVEGVVKPDTLGLLILLAVGVTSTVGQLLMTYAMQFTRAGEAGIVQMTTVIYSSAAGIIWLGDPFSFRTLAGAVLVLGSAAYISLVHNRLTECR